MVRTIKAGLAFTALAVAFLLQPSVHAEDNMKQDSMKQDDMFTTQAGPTATAYNVDVERLLIR